MGETVNISEMAELLSKEIFEYFGWTRRGPTNENWACVDKERHGRKTHPADVVYWYYEPYDPKITYVHCDLKSYARGSITKASLKEAIENLNDSLSCARKSPSWHEKFDEQDIASEVKAMLFVYNHDNGFDDDFDLLLTEATKNIEIDSGNIISVIGPRRISYLTNVVQNINVLMGKKELPERSEWAFFHPELVDRRICFDTSKLPMTLEQIWGSYHIIKYHKDGNVVGYDVYIDSTSDERGMFAFLLEHLRRCNCLETNRKIRFFAPFATPETSNNFAKAYSFFVDYMDAEHKEKVMAQIKYEHIAALTKHQFFSQDIGMRR